MNITINRNNLLVSLQSISKVIPSRTTLPIIQCVYFEGSDRSLYIRGTDLEIEIESIVEDFSFAIPVFKLIEILISLNEEKILITINENERIDITTKTGKFSIMGQNKQEYPPSPKIENANIVTIDNFNFKEIINSTLYAASRDDMKPALQGVLIKVESNTITSVATDGHRLAKTISTNNKNQSYTGSFILPGKFLDIIKTQTKDSKNIEITINENHVSIKNKNKTFKSRIIKEKFPDYERVIPKENKHKIKLNKSEITESLKRVNIFSNKTTKQVVLCFNENKIKIETEDPDNTSKGKEEILCDFSGESLNIGFNGQYLLDMLSRVDEESFFIKFESALSAVMIETEKEEMWKKTNLLMPIRIS